ncbi:MAG: polymerase sigma-70 factor, subfamily [Streptosporangiaceae bacterium]|nr:polymerase sigma-70 factor, subfamily [Streptosporangiaceae bacterium]
MPIRSGSWSGRHDGPGHDRDLLHGRCPGPGAARIVPLRGALQRARAHLERVAPAEDDIAESLDADHRALLDRYVKAFESADIDTLLRVLHSDVTLEMPPEPLWFAGREAVSRFLASRIFVGPGILRLLPVTANGQPALATYWRGEDRVFHAHAIQVLTLSENKVARIVVFRDPSLFPAFGLPRDLGAAEVPTAPWRP